MMDDLGMEFYSKASLSVSIQRGDDFMSVAYRRTMISESSHPSRTQALEECFKNFSMPGVNCWVTSDVYDVHGAPSPGTRLPVVIDPFLNQDLRDFLDNMVRRQNIQMIQ